MINETNGVLVLKTPYSAGFVADLKKSVSGCRWDATNKAWMAPLGAKETCVSLLIKHFNFSAGNVSGLTVIITAKEDVYSLQDSVRFSGVPVARAMGRDSGATVCSGVTLLSGYIGSAGSVKNWKTSVSAGARLRVELPAGITPVEDEKFSFELVKDASEKEKLLAEKEALLKRLAEIEALLD